MAVLTFTIDLKSVSWGSSVPNLLNELGEAEFLPEPVYALSLSPANTLYNDTTGIICPEDISTYTDLNSCDALVTSGLAILDPDNIITSLTWEMAGATHDQSPASGVNQLSSYVFNEGATVVTYRGRTLNNNPVFCTFTVTVSDNQVPRLISSPGHITVRNRSGECYANVSWTEPSAADNCVPQDQLIFTSNYSSGQQFQVGSTQVEYRISDGVNTAVHSFTVTVIDAEAPELIAPSDLESECGKPVPDAFTTWEQFEQAGGSANDNCFVNFGSFRYVGQTSSGITCPYTVTRTYSIWDIDGNVSEAKHVIRVIGEGMAYEAKVESTEPEVLLEPGAETQAEILFAKTDVSCKGSRTGSVDLTVSGTTGSLSFVWSTQNGSGIVQGNEDQTTLCDGDYTVMVYEDGVRLIAFDFSILVFDDQAPVLNAPSTIQRTCGQSIPDAYSTWSEFANAGGTVRDNCQIYYSSFRLSSESKSNPDCPYTLTRVYEITDVNGNRGFAEHVISVEAEEVYLKSGMAGTITAQATGDWNVASTWDCNCIPAFDDDVIIPSGLTVTVDAAAVANNITIETGGTLNGGASTLQVNGNWTNNGTFTASTGTIEFTGSADAIISGSSSTAFNEFILNKGSDVTTDLAVQSDIAITDLTFNNGVLDVESGTTDIADIVNINNTIPSTSGLRVSGGTLTTGYYSIINEGLIEVTSGTATFGTGSGNTVHTQVDGAFIVSGGTVDIAGRLENTAGGTLSGYLSGINISGGTITLATAGNNESGAGSLDVTTNGAFNFTGGTIVFENPSTAGTALDLGLIDGTGNGAKTITNGIFQFGNNNTIVGSTFYIGSNVPIPNITTFAGSELYLAMPPDDGETIACASSATEPTPPNVYDNCGALITPTGPDVGGTYVDCEGTITYTWEYLDCDGTTTTNWVYTYTIDYSGGLAALPANTTGTVSCPDDAVDPGAPATIQDACGRNVVPVLVGSVETPDPVTCEGTVVWTYRYTTCDGTTYDWTHTYTINDNIPPTWETLQNDLDIELECDNSEGLTAAQALAPVASDNCAGTISYTKNSGVFVPVASGSTEGTYTNTWTAADACGNITATPFTQVITIIDTTPPTPICQPLTIQLDATGNATITPDQIDNGSNDNCTAAGDLILALDITGFTCDDLGANTVTLTVTDEAGNSSTCTATVTVEDKTPPVMVAIPQIDTACTIDTIIPPVMNDVCDGPIVGTTTTTFPIDTEGLTTITWTFTDNSGNIATRNQEVFIKDDEAPNWSDLTFFSSTLNIYCPQDTSPATTGIPEATDNCDLDTIYYSDNVIPGRCDANYTVQRTWTAIDASGNINSKVQTIYRDDVDQPTLLCRDTTVNTPDDIWEPTELQGISWTDECGIDTVFFEDQRWNFTENGVAGFCPESVVRTYTVYDKCGNASTCEQTIYVDDLSSCSTCQDEVPYRLVDLDGAPDSTWILTENIVRSGYCCYDTTFTNDTRCISFNVYLDEDAVGLYMTVQKPGPSGSEWYKVNCQDSAHLGEVICLTGGQFYTLTFCKPGQDKPEYIIQSISGAVTADSLTTRADVECFGDLEVTGLEQGTIEWSVSYPFGADSLIKYLDDPYSANPTFTPDSLTPALIKYEVCGAVSGFPECDGDTIYDCTEVIVNVLPPVNIYPDQVYTTICIDSIPLVTAEIPFEDPALQYDIQWLYEDGTPITGETGRTYQPPGTGTYGVRVTEVTSGVGCATDEYYFAIVADTIGPILLIPPDTLRVDCSSSVLEGDILTWINEAEAFENEDSTISKSVYDDFDYSTFNPECGLVQVVHFWAYDECSNMTYDSAYIVVEDDLPPTITPAYDSIADCNTFDHNTYDGYLAWLANHGGATATDDCQDPETLSWTADTATAVWEGDGARDSIIVTFTVTDDCDNPASTTATFTIVDDQPPTIICSDSVETIISLDSCSSDTFAIDSVFAYDNCSVPDLEWVLSGATSGSGTGQVIGERFNVGVTTVHYTATDAAGLTDTCSFTVWVKHLDPPTGNIFCPEDTVRADAAGYPDCDVSLDLDTVEYIDPCNEIDSIWNDSPAPEATWNNADGTYEIGITEFNWYILDVSDNVDTCHVVVIVSDTTSPLFTDCPENVEDSLYNGGCDIIPDSIDYPVWDPDCSPLELYYELTLPNDSIVRDSGFVNDYRFPIGQTDVMYILQDTFGNADYCSFYVLIKDTLQEGSDYECPDITLIEEYATQIDCEPYISLNTLNVIDTCDAIDTFWHTSPYGTPEDPSDNYPIGHHSFRWMVRNYAGDVDSTCEVNIIVYDTISPYFESCPDPAIDSLTNNDCDKVLNLEDPVPGDDCSPLSLYYELTLPNDSIVRDSGLASDYIWPIGQTDVRYILRDSAGNEAYCEFYVLIKSTLEEGYAYECPTGGEEWADRDSCGAWVSLEAPTVTDTCDAIDSIWHDSDIYIDSMDPSGFYDIGTTYFNWYIKERDGDTIVCPVEVIVHDYMPELTCPPDTTVFAIYNQLYAVIELPSPTFHDNCPDSTLIWDARWEGNSVLTYGDTASNGINILTGPDTFNVGITYIEYIFTDQHGHDTSCTFTVTVEAAPVIACPDPDTFYADDQCEFWFDPGVATLTSGAQPIWWTWTITDEYDNILDFGRDTTTATNTVLSPIVPTAPNKYPFQLGVTTITWTAENQAGSDTCQHAITVLDTTPPVFYELDSLEDCMEVIQYAIYSASEGDLYYPDRPDYIVFEKGDTTLDLTILDEYEDNCELSCVDSINWVIDFSAYTDQNGTNVSAQDSAYWGHGQLSDWNIFNDDGPYTETELQFPGDGTYMGDVEHWISYFVTDCAGNTSLVGRRRIIVTPRPKIDKLNFY